MKKNHSQIHHFPTNMWPWEGENMQILPLQPELIFMAQTMGQPSGDVMAH